jgi:hypothetical protein
MVIEPGQPSLVFGHQHRVKRVMIVQEVGSKSVDYTLEVPGGFVFVGIVRRGVAWNESEWEQYFQSIQMIKR